MKNPYINALFASTYIALIASFFTYAPMVMQPMAETPLAPMVLLSLLVLSVAVMGFLFFYEPLNLFMDGKRREAVTFFLRTIGTFIVITLCALGALVFLSNSTLANL